MGSFRPFGIAFPSLCIAIAVLASRSAQALSVSGDVSYTTDYISRGISETDGRGAGQLDVHVTTAGGTFAGVFGSTLGKVNNVRGWDATLDKVSAWGWDAEFEAYLGHRFDLSPSWSTTVTAVNYSYLGGNVPLSNDYQELTAALSYLDRWTVSVAAAPNAVRHIWGQRLGRYPAYVVDASVQLPLIGRLFLTGGLGYYSAVGPFASAYAYGNAGLAFEYKALRIDAGYYTIQERAQALFPYGLARNRFAGTLSCHF